MIHCFLIDFLNGCIRFQDMRLNMEGEQPFPDSWISTTAPIALGCLTDIASEVIISHGSDGAKILWPPIERSFQRWCNGDAKSYRPSNIGSVWSPCEALVRVACREINRFSSRLTERLGSLNGADAAAWSNSLVTFLSETLNQSLNIELAMKKKLIDDKLRAFRRSNPSMNGFANKPLIKKDEKVDLTTPYGRGLLVDRRIDDSNGGLDVVVDVVKLDFGILYQATSKSFEDEADQGTTHCFHQKDQFKLPN
jgi:hypothetical protein